MMFFGLALGLALLGSIFIGQGVMARTYCITGNSTGVGWSWAINGKIEMPRPGGQPPIAIPVQYSGTVGDGEVASGQGPEALRDEFVFSLLTKLRLPARVRKISENYFSVTGFSISGLDTMVLSVGPVGEPRACAVGRRGCSFNPTISEVSSSAVSSTTQWGLIALGLLLAGSLVWMIRRRFTTRPAGA